MTMGDRDIRVGAALAAALAAVCLLVIAVTWWWTPAREQPAGSSGRPTVTVTYTAPRGAPAEVVLPGTWCPTPGDRAVTLDGSAVVCGSGGTARATRWERAR